MHICIKSCRLCVQAKSSRVGLSSLVAIRFSSIEVHKLDRRQMECLIKMNV